MEGKEPMRKGRDLLGRSELGSMKEDGGNWELKTKTKTKTKLTKTKTKTKTDKLPN